MAAGEAPKGHVSSAEETVYLDCFYRVGGAAGRETAALTGADKGVQSRRNKVLIETNKAYPKVAGQITQKKAEAAQGHWGGLN